MDFINDGIADYLLEKYKTKKNIRKLSEMECNIINNYTDPENTLYIEGFFSNCKTKQDVIDLLKNNFISRQWDKYKEIEKKMESQKIIREPNTNLQCFKCKEKKVDAMEMITRSADEPMTVSYVCLNCGNNWKK